ncbi:MAG: 50S ribosomal protein L19 [Planctomycetes bacterium]|nr:50S ribosomal protein L19 [Planctomycetota bacterium]
MRNQLFDVIEKKYQRPNTLEFEIGDTVVVTLRIVEGSKERLQDFEGTVIARRGSGLDEMFTVRKIVANEGVERVFPLHSPKVVAIKSLRSGRVRRCKLYYLRDRVGKARKLRARRISAEARRAAAEARAAKARQMAETQAAVAAARERSASSEATDTEMAASPS